jgi:hypothetical protein
MEARLLAAKSVDLSDEKNLRTVLDPLIEEFDQLPPDDKTRAWMICVSGLLEWIDKLDTSSGAAGP